METENKYLIQKFEKINLNKKNKVPEFYLNKISMTIYTNSYYYKNLDNNWNEFIWIKCFYLIKYGK